MRLRTLFFVILACLATYGAVHAQKPWKDYSDDFTEYIQGEIPIPPDYAETHDFTRARLKYTRVGVLHREPYDTGRWGWATDYPRGDRHFLDGLRRLTLIDAQSVEQVVELDGSDDIFNWPFLYGVEVGHWKLFSDEADQFREYLDRGGFFMTDDFHGTIEWANFMENGVHSVFPTRPVVDIANSDEIFHVMYDLSTRVQIPGWQWSQSRRIYEFDGFEPKWRAVYDDKGRVMMAILHNMDISDAIEWSDDPRYPEEWANLAYRISVNYVLYDLTH